MNQDASWWRQHEEEQRRQEATWYEQGRRRSDEELARFFKRYAKLGAALLFVAGVLAETADIWIGTVFTRRDDPVLQVLGMASDFAFTFTNRDSSALTDCDATVRDAMGVEWRAPVTGRIAANQQVEVAWSGFTHGGESIEAEVGRARGVVLSCYVERLRARRSAMFDRRGSRHAVTR